MFDKRQKKIINYTFQAIIFISSIVMFIIGIGFQFHWFDNVGEASKYGWLISLLSVVVLQPNTIIGIWVKLWLNKHHLKAIDTKLEEVGIKPLEPEKQVLKSKKKDEAPPEIKKADGTRLGNYPLY